MKRLVVGGLLAAIAWMIGTQFNPWYAKYLGLLVGFISGLLLEDWQVTKQVATEKWRKTIAWKPDWKLFGQYVLNNILTLTFFVMWVVVFELMKQTGISPYLTNGDNVGLLTLICICAVFLSFFLMVLTSLVPLISFGKNFKYAVDLSKEMSYFSMKYLTPISLIFLAFFCLIVYVIPFTFQLLLKIPGLVVSMCEMMKKFCLFVTYTLISLIAREKTLAFAICVTTGAGVGMYMGKTIIYGAVAALTASTMIFISDKLREFAQNKLELLKS